VIQTSGDSASGHHALIRRCRAARPSTTGARTGPARVPSARIWRAAAIAALRLIRLHRAVFA
jgi:hypothetical protein